MNVIAPECYIFTELQINFQNGLQYCESFHEAINEYITRRNFSKAWIASLC